MKSHISREVILNLNSPIPQPNNAFSEGACPICDGADRTVRFNWRLSSETSQGEFKKYTRTLLEKNPLKVGFLFECPTCGQQWYLDGLREMMTVIPRNKTALIEKWNASPLFLSSDLFKKAKSIGATPVHQNSTERNYAEVPCKVLTRKGENIDKCLLLFRNGPPLESYGRAIGFIQDIADLTPSDYALPFEVRAASSQSKETRTGSALTPVESNQGVRFNLNWAVNFFDKKNIQGKDIHLLMLNPQNKRQRFPIISEPIGDITFFMGDFNENTSKLFNP